MGASPLRPKIGRSFFVAPGGHMRKPAKDLNAENSLIDDDFQTDTIDFRAGGSHSLWQGTTRAFNPSH